MVVGALAAAVALSACATDPSDGPEEPTAPSVDPRDDADDADGDADSDADGAVDEPEAGPSELPDAGPDEQPRSGGNEGSDDTDTRPPPPPPAEPVELSGDEVLPNAKRLASDLVLELTTYEVGDPAVAVAERALGDRSHVVETRQLAAAIEPLHHERAWSRGRIVYPQLGGATTTDASVMVVVHQQLGFEGGEMREETRTVDVRLTLVDGAWAFAGIADAGGEPVPRPDDLGDDAAAVLDDERIELPDSAAWDIHAGHVDPQLLRAMRALADRHGYGVAVLDTGHPVTIFDTDRVSSHLYGVAVDVYHLDGELVVEGREDGSGSPLYRTVEWLYDQPEVTNLGSPWALDGYGGRSFTDLVHQDHLHIQAGEKGEGPPPHHPELAELFEDEDDGDASAEP